MSLTRAEVAKVAELARLSLSEAELDQMTTQLGRVLDFVKSLDEVDTSGVEPMAHALDVDNVLRDDVPAASLPREAALSNAPKSDGVFYLAPAVLGE